ncbi:MAG TPA: tetratricopeptide repeat protein [Pyrinomonadaceae bacterium]|nr:tetratricopeptide repeat protein [Pyrinomonadaceae bacterium]
MKRSTLSPVLAAILLVCGAPLYRAEAKESWTSVRSKNFLLVGNASEKDIRRIGLQLEQFRDVLARVLAEAKTTSTSPITVVVFRNDESFRQFRPPAASAYFQSGQDMNYIALTAERKGENPYAPVFHEYVHFLVRNNIKNAPLWFNEGLAEYYSSFDISDGERRVIIGRSITSHVMHLRQQQRMLPLETLFAVNHTSPIYNEKDKKGIFYAQSWALVHYLLLGNEGRRAPQLKRFLALLASNMAVEAAFRQAFETDFATLERELRQYIGRHSYRVEVKTFDEKPAFDRQLRSAPLTEAESQFYLGDLLLHLSDLDRAEEYLRQAVTLDPDLAVAHASLGMLGVRRGRFEEARRHLQRAVSADTKNYLVHYNYAYMLSREAMLAGSYVSSFAPETAQTMRAELGKAIELEPGYAESYYLLAFINVVTGEHLDESVELLRRAVSLAPGEKHFETLLAKLYIRRQDFKQARRILEPLAHGPADTQVMEQARSLLQQLTAIEEQMALYGAGSNAESTGAVPSASGHSAASETVPDGKEPRPAFEQELLPRREGEEQARGQLLRIDCEAQGVTMAVKVGDRTLRLHNNELKRIRFITYTPEMHGRIACGPREPTNTVIVSYRPAGDGRSQTDGVATAIAFIPKELEAPQ